MSQYLWGRKYRIQVVTGMEKDEDGKETGNEIALDVSNLHCVFEVHKKRDEGGSYAVVKIYNLNSQTEQKLITEGDRLIIEAGYKGLTKQDHLVDIDTGEPWVTQVDTRKTAMDTDDGVQVTIGTEPARYGKIFDGKITWPSRSKESNVDYVLTLMAIDGDDPLNLNYISKTVGKVLISVRFWKPSLKIQRPKFRLMSFQIACPRRGFRVARCSLVVHGTISGMYAVEMPRLTT